LEAETEEVFFPGKVLNHERSVFLQKGVGVKSEWVIVFCFIQRVNLVVCVKCWGEGINVGVCGITSMSRLGIKLLETVVGPNTTLQNRLVR